MLFIKDYILLVFPGLNKPLKGIKYFISALFPALPAPAGTYLTEALAAVIAFVTSVIALPVN